MTGACQVLKEDDMSAKGAFGFVAGGILGAAAGVVAGILLAPRSGAESRAMAADAMNDAWDTAVDSYERGSRVVSEKIGSRPGMDVTADELRAKVDLARERMEQLRDSLSDAVTTTSSQVQDVVNSAADKVVSASDAATPAGETQAEGVHVEVVDGNTEE